MLMILLQCKAFFCFCFFFPRKRYNSCFPSLGILYTIQELQAETISNLCRSVSGSVTAQWGQNQEPIGQLPTSTGEILRMKATHSLLPEGTILFREREGKLAMCGWRFCNGRQAAGAVHGTEKHPPFLPFSFVRPRARAAWEPQTSRSSGSGWLKPPNALILNVNLP